MDKAPTEMFDIYSTASVAMMSGRNKRRALIYAKNAKLYNENNLTTPVCNIEVYNRGSPWQRNFQRHRAPIILAAF